MLKLNLSLKCFKKLHLKQANKQPILCFFHAMTLLKYYMQNVNLGVYVKNETQVF